MRKNEFILLILLCLGFSSCEQNPNDLLIDARLKLNEAEHITYEQTGFYPNPMGAIDTLKVSMEILINSDSFLGYDFLIQGKTKDEYYIKGEYKSVRKNENEVNIFPADQADEMEVSIRNNRNIQYNPITVLNKDDWSYVSDTIENNVAIISFKRVETDTIVDGNKIYTVQYIFINSKTKLLERIERRNFYNGELSQTIIYQYKDYNISLEKAEIDYSISEDFVTVPFGQDDKNRFTLLAGEKAPEFKVANLQSKWITQKDYQDKKLVLMFSVINCGYCLLAMEDLTDKNFELSDNYSMASIFPLDSKENVANYMNRFDPSFDIFADAKEMGESYGVYAYPLFFVIDQEGKIEKTVEGYDKEFLASLRK